MTMVWNYSLHHQNFYPGNLEIMLVVLRRVFVLDFLMDDDSFDSRSNSAILLPFISSQIVIELSHPHPFPYDQSTPENLY